MAHTPDPISENLQRYSIGEKLRTLRLRKNMGLVELSKHTGLSAALLSKLERGKLFPTLPTLLRIAMVYSVGLDYFFTDERKRCRERNDCRHGVVLQVRGPTSCCCYDGTQPVDQSVVGYPVRGAGVFTHACVPL